MVRFELIYKMINKLLNFCDCKELSNLNVNYSELFQWVPMYGWTIKWTELTEEHGYTQVHNYGIAISFCPMCGKRLKSLSDKDE